MKTYYKRRLPHLHPIGATFFVTWRLHGSLPGSVVQQLSQEHIDEVQRLASQNLPFDDHEEKLHLLRFRYFLKFDKALDSATHEESPHCLHQPEAATIVKNFVAAYDGLWYHLYALCIMSNHVHAVMDFSAQLRNEHLSPLDAKPYKQLWQVMKHIKGASAIQINQLLNREGRLWQEESYDRYIRNPNHLNNAIRYTYMNPVKAGICKNWQDYPFTYVKK